jgi:WD40 repeat protein
VDIFKECRNVKDAIYRSFSRFNGLYLCYAPLLLVVTNAKRECQKDGFENEVVQIWDAITGAVLQTFKGHSDWVTSVAFSSNGEQVMSGSGDKTVRLWDAATGVVRQTHKGHSG